MGEECREKYTHHCGFTHKGSHLLGSWRRTQTTRYKSTEKWKHPREQAETETQGNIQVYTLRIFKPPRCTQTLKHIGKHTHRKAIPPHVQTHTDSQGPKENMPATRCTNIYHAT